jgi:hypothetical protein
MSQQQQQVEDFTNVNFIAATQDAAMLPARREQNEQNGANPQAAKRRATSTDAGAGPSRASNDSNNQRFSALTGDIYAEITQRAKAEVQTAVSAVVKVEQEAVRAEVHLQKLQQQAEQQGRGCPKFLQVQTVMFRYNSAEAQAEADAATQEYQLKLLAAAVKGAAAQLQTAQQEQLSVKVSAMLQMQHNTFSGLPDSWATDSTVTQLKAEQQQLFEWELAKAMRSLKQSAQQQAHKEQKKAAAAAAMEVEAGPVTLEEQVEQLVAKAVPKVLAASSGANNSSRGGSSTGGTGGKQKGTGGKQQQKQQQQPKPPAPPAAANKTYLEAAGGRSRSRSRARSRSSSRPRHYNPNNKGGSGGGGKESSSGANQGNKGANKQRQQQQQRAAAG